MPDTYFPDGLRNDLLVTLRPRRGRRRNRKLFADLGRDRKIGVRNREPRLTDDVEQLLVVDDERV